MDYTNNPARNKQPDDSNFQFLYALYGLVPGAVPYTAPTAAPTTEAQANENTSALSGTADNGATDSGSNTGTGGGDGDGRNRPNRQRPGQRRAAIVFGEPIPHWLQESKDNAIRNLETYGRGVEQGWRLLHQTLHIESHEIDLEDGIKLQVHMLRSLESIR